MLFYTLITVFNPVLAFGELEWLAKSEHVWMMGAAAFKISRRMMRMPPIMNLHPEHLFKCVHNGLI